MSALLRSLSLFILITLSGAVCADSTELRVGDVLYIALPGEEALNKEFQVDHQGELLLPEVGEVSGPLPGLIEDADYAEIRVKLEKGQRLVMYTDGLFESVTGAARQAELEQRIVKVMNDSHVIEINQLANGIMAEFDALAGSVPRDDATLVILEKQ